MRSSDGSSDVGSSELPSIGPSRCVDHRLLASDSLERLLDRLLDRRAVRLPLPAHERATVIFDGEAVARHATGVPGGRAQPRSSACGSIGALPCRWTRVGRIAPAPQAMVMRSSMIVAGVPLSPKISAARMFTRPPAISQNAPGAGLKARMEGATW